MSGPRSARASEAGNDTPAALRTSIFPPIRPSSKLLYHGPLEKRLFFAAGLAIWLFALWPSVALFNRAEPFILGLPPFLFFSLVVFVAVPLLLLAALLRKI